MFREDRMYRPDEIAAIFMISRRTVYRLIDAGELAATKMDNMLRISGAELNRYLRQHEHDPLGIGEK